MADRSAYGGQAVIEGVMIRGKSRVATACRIANGKIVVRLDEAETLAARYPWMKLAFVRGLPALIDSLRLGYRTLMWSADQVMDSEQQPKPTKWQTFLVYLGAFSVGIGLFVLLPTLVTHYLFPHAMNISHSGSLLKQLTPSAKAILPNIIEGLMRILLLICYILVISRHNEIKRIFSYHGAEHKVVNSWEARGELGVDIARDFSRIHPRCGTSFLFLVFIVGIFVHALVGWPESHLLRMATRLLMLPIIAGIAYELIRLSGRFRNSKLLGLLISPGLLLQRLTTAEPNDEQIEVALFSMRSVLEDEGVLEKATPVAAEEEKI